MWEKLVPPETIPAAIGTLDSNKKNMIPDIELLNVLWRNAVEVNIEVLTSMGGMRLRTITLQKVENVPYG